MIIRSFSVMHNWQITELGFPLTFNAIEYLMEKLMISVHSRNILNLIVQSYGCNCRVKSSCPLNGECLTPKIIYWADVPNNKNSKKKFYFSLADTPFKERYRKHTRDFKHEKYENCTKLAKYIWQLKCSNINFSIKYSIASKVSGNPSSVICQLCITEK